MPDYCMLKFTAPFEVPDDVFLVLALVEDGLEGVSGKIKCADEFFEILNKQ